MGASSRITPEVVGLPSGIICACTSRPLPQFLRLTLRGDHNFFEALVCPTAIGINDYCPHNAFAWHATGRPSATNCQSHHLGASRGRCHADIQGGRHMARPSRPAGVRPPGATGCLGKLPKRMAFLIHSFTAARQGDECYVTPKRLNGIRHVAGLGAVTAQPRRVPNQRPHA